MKIPDLNSRIEDKGNDCVIGIDTGGTYTDGVLLDYQTRNLLASGKTLTTYDDLTRGVIKVLKELQIEEPSKIKLVGISSTLATNSIAEGKTRQVGLILIGYDADLVYSYGMDAKFATKKFEFFKGGHNSQGEEQEALDIKGVTDWVKEYLDDLDALAISSYFSPLNPSHEEEILSAVRKISSIPVVLGHQLSTKLDSIKRATTACLNASLVAVMHEFIEAVQKSLKDMGIHAPLMIVKGDGSLMPYTEAAQKPVETILSGPAASSIGGRFLSGQSTALVIDVGGTTTDMALIEDSQIAISQEGVRVGNIETAVKAARIRTACVGCDSRISILSEREFEIGPDRVTPLSRLAWQHPEVEKELVNLKNKKGTSRTTNDIEYWLLSKDIDPESIPFKDDKRRNLLLLLNKRPLSLSNILKKMNVMHAVQLNAEPLFQRGYIETATLTPTDLLHVNGQMDIWSSEAVNQALRYICKIFNKNVGSFIEESLNKIVAYMVKEAVIFLARQTKSNKLPEFFDGEWGQWFFEEGLNGTNQFLSVTIASRFPIIGIGAPASIFVKRVAEELHARFVLPSHPHVANAVGAVAGSVIVDKEAIVYVQETERKRSYVVQFEGEASFFKESDDALRFAEKIVAKSALNAANEAGADSPQVETQKNIEGGLKRVTARAVGNPKLSEQWNPSTIRQ